MHRLAPPPLRRDRRITQQESDFTAEGAPPPGRVATAAPLTPGQAATPHPLDALDWWARGHASLQRLFRDYGHLRQWCGGDFGRALLAQRIRTQLRLHLQIEEEILCPAARALLPGDRALAHATLDIRGMLELLDRLDAMPLDDPDFDAALAVLEAYVAAHVREVEDQIFPALRQGGLDTIALGAQVALRFVSLGLDPARFGAGRPRAGAQERSPADLVAMR